MNATLGVGALCLVVGVGACAAGGPKPGTTTTTTTLEGPKESVADAGGAAAEGPKAIEAPAHATVEELPVRGDRAASLVRAADGSAPRIVFLPGLCSNANAYLQNFPEAARRHGGAVAIEGDQPCVPGFRSFSWDAAKQHARIDAALAAAGALRVADDSQREGVTLVGYSQGAAIGEQLVARWPRRYARVVLIGAPTEPSTAKLASARALVTMSCSRDVPGRMRDAAKRASAAGVPATYVEMPGCTHGNIADGERVFDEVFDWMSVNER